MERSGPRLWANRRKQEVLLALLREIREDKKLTQVAVAKKLNWPQTRVSRCEVGRRRLDLLELRDLCKVLSVSVVDFVRTFDNAATVLEGAASKKGRDRFRRKE